MRDYQRKKNNPYILPWNLYRQTLYAIRDYDRLNGEYKDALLGSSASMDGQPRGTKFSDPTADTATSKKVEFLHNKLRAIDAAKETIPSEYIKGVWSNIVYDAPYPMDASRRTYGYYKSKFVYEVAKNLTIIF